MDNARIRAPYSANVSIRLRLSSAPLDSIIAVYPLVEIGHKYTIGVTAPPHIHRHKNITAPGEVLRRHQHALAQLEIGRACQDNRISSRFSRFVDKPIDISRKRDSVPHGHALVEFDTDLTGSGTGHVGFPS